MMNFFEAMTALQNGRKIRRMDWKEHEWLGLKEQQFKLFGLPKSSFIGIKQDGKELEGLELRFCLSNDWEEFKEKVSE